MSEFELRDVPVQHTAVVQVTTTVDMISTTMGEAFAKAYAAVGRSGQAPAGPAICKYTTFDAQTVSYEAGVPVTSPFAGDGDVVAGEIGGGTAAVGMHVGPYDTLGDTYGRLQAWLERQGRKPSAVMWERYLNDPDTTPAAELRTEIYWPAEEE